MANNIFDLLGIDLDATLKNIINLKNNIVETYNDNVDNLKGKIKRYDLKTQEGYEDFIKDAADVRKNLQKTVDEEPNTFNGLVAKYLLSTLDKLVEKTMSYHNENHVVKNHDECDTDTCRGKNTNITDEVKIIDTPEFNDEDRPSNKLNYKQSRNIWKLVDEYMENMIEPYLPENIDENLVENVASGLFEFAAWLLTKEN